MTILTDDLIEKARAVLIEGLYPPAHIRRAIPDTAMKEYDNLARAALQAVLPDVVEKAEQYRRERDVLLELVKGSPGVMKAYEMLKTCNRINIWWGPEGTPESVAAEVAKALEQIAAGDFDEVPDEAPISPQDAARIADEAVKIVGETSASIRSLLNKEDNANG